MKRLSILLLAMSLPAAGAASEAPVAADPAAFADWNPPDERAVRVFDEPCERLLHFVQGGKGVQTIDALADFLVAGDVFAGRLAGAEGAADEQGDQAREQSQHAQGR